MKRFFVLEKPAMMRLRLQRVSDLCMSGKYVLDLLVNRRRKYFCHLVSDGAFLVVASLCEIPLEVSVKKQPLSWLTMIVLYPD